MLADQETSPWETGDHGNKIVALSTSGVLTDGLLEVEGH